LEGARWLRRGGVLDNEGRRRVMLVLASSALPLLTTAGLPEWAWATLIVALFAGLSVVTFVATRYPTEAQPPPFDAPEPAERRQREE
jgi:hypothetical protein